MIIPHLSASEDRSEVNAEEHTMDLDKTAEKRGQEEGAQILSASIDMGHSIIKSRACGRTSQRLAPRRRKKKMGV